MLRSRRIGQRLLGRIQDENLAQGRQGFTEFVPLPFVHTSAPIYLAGVARPGPTLRDNLAVHAMARILLHGRIRNIQTSWVKLGVDGTRAMLQAGANDLGGTLMEETISRMAGSEHGGIDGDFVEPRKHRTGERKARIDVGSRGRLQQADARVGETDRNDAREPGEHDALRERLANDAQARRAERAADRDFLLARGAADEQKIRDVGADDREHDSDRNDEHA